MIHKNVNPVQIARSVRAALRHSDATRDTLRRETCRPVAALLIAFSS